ncbi:venom serine protease inhibitor-like [Danaus plexippus]|uniref:venom serine protease inhibitor-like n=1 Tax=Danaus plexippus TaxID=13037 RepID=UPI002AB20218|nr:venom serine protease inhibitor-like [Danaus plexippus]
MNYLSICCVLFALFLSYVCAVPPARKPLDCPANEIYKECSLEVCYKTCEHLKNPPPCPSIAAGCYLPSCECKDDYLRNENGVCVPYKECSI